MMAIDVAGKTALVIGGSSGIGLALAQGFQAAGARVAIASRTPEKLEAARARLGGGEARSYVVDATDVAEIEQLVLAVLADFGQVDVLVNSQGTTVLKPAEEVTPAEFDLVMNTNVRSVFFACTCFGRHMLARGKGCIINIASLAGHRGWPQASAYAASKHGVVGLTRTFAAEWAGRGVRVNAISPGVFMTELNRDRMAPERKQNAMRRIPAGRFGEVGELVSTAVFLASDGAGYVTGTVLNVDGGYLAGGI
jgi:NAD(P)-dependent dehydrogenase (short-subunit alcohol dehydrogenase family)